MLRDRVVPQSEVIRAIVLEGSPCCRRSCDRRPLATCAAPRHEGRLTGGWGGEVQQGGRQALPAGLGRPMSAGTRSQDTSSTQND